MGLLSDPTDRERVMLGDERPPISRPIMFGDVFEEVHCSRGGDPGTVMVVSHPCTMRRGPELRALISVAAVVDSPQPTWSAERWANGQFDYLPIDSVRAPEDHAAVHFVDLHSAASSELDTDRRLSALSDYGIAVFLQRWIFQLSRDLVALPELSELVAPVLAEAEIEEDWAAAALESRPDDDKKVVLAEAGHRVQEVLGGHGPDTIRSMLKASLTRADARRRVAAARREELGR